MGFCHFWHFGKNIVVVVIVSSAFCANSWNGQQWLAIISLRYRRPRSSCSIYKEHITVGFLHTTKGQYYAVKLTSLFTLTFPPSLMTGL